MNKYNWLFGIVLALSCLMTACTSQPTLSISIGTHGQTSTVTSSHTPEPSLTSTSTSTSTNSPTPIPSSTKTFLPVATSTPTPISLPLDTQGPWIVVEKSTSDIAQQVYYVTGLRGTDWVPLNAPEIPNQIKKWAVIPSPEDGYIAFVDDQISGDQIPQLYEHNQGGLNLNILKLPENKIVRTIPLLGSKAIEQINQEGASNIFPVKLNVLTNSSIFRWSPDGRYLAYPAVDSIYPDVYLYDTMKDTIERLTHEETGAIPWVWSPDGRWLLYRQTTDNDYDLMRNLPEFKAVYAYSFITKSHFLYKAQWLENIKWITAHKFLIYSSYECMDCGNNLREGDLETGSVRQLYPGDFNGPYYDPVYQSILLNFTPNAYLSFDIEPGIYRLNRNTLSLNIFLPGYFEFGYWSKELKKYVVYARTENDVENFTPIIYDENGKEIFRLPEAKYYPPELQALQPSSDGNWFYVLDDEKTSLYTNQGALIKTLERRNVFWLRDSSGLLQVGSSKTNSINLYEQNQNWEPRLIHFLGDENSYSNAFLIYP